MRDGVCFEKENAVANDTKSATTWCGYGDLNPNALRHENLNLACLPIPSYPQIYKNDKK